MTLSLTDKFAVVAISRTPGRWVWNLSDEDADRLRDLQQRGFVFMAQRRVSDDLTALVAKRGRRMVEMEKVR